MDLSTVMPEVTAETMRQTIVDIEKHPYAQEILITILTYVKRANQKRKVQIAVANIRGITHNRLWEASHKRNDTTARALLEEQATHDYESRMGNHIALNPRRWKPAIFLEAIRTLCTTELTRRSYTWRLFQKTKKHGRYSNPKKRNRYWVLELKWA